MAHFDSDGNAKLSWADMSEMFEEQEQETEPEPGPDPEPEILPEVDSDGWETVRSKKLPFCTLCKCRGHYRRQCNEFRPDLVTKTCYNCGERGHLAATCAVKQQCYKCGGTGHIRKKCPQK